MPAADASSLPSTSRVAGDAPGSAASVSAHTGSRSPSRARFRFAPEPEPDRNLRLVRPPPLVLGSLLLLRLPCRGGRARRHSTVVRASCEEAREAQEEKARDQQRRRPRRSRLTYRLHRSIVGRVGRARPCSNGQFVLVSHIRGAADNGLMRKMPQRELVTLVDQNAPPAAPVVPRPLSRRAAVFRSSFPSSTARRTCARRWTRSSGRGTPRSR